MGKDSLLIRKYARAMQPGPFHLLAKQHMIPVLPKNQQHPIKRTNDKAAIVQSKAWKKRAVRTVALLYARLSVRGKDLTCRFRSTYRKPKLVQAVASNGQRQQRVGEYPGCNQPRAEVPVGVLQRRLILCLRLNIGA